MFLRPQRQLWNAWLNNFASSLSVKHCGFLQLNHVLFGSFQVTELKLVFLCVYHSLASLYYFIQLRLSILKLVWTTTFFLLCPGPFYFILFYSKRVNFSCTRFSGETKIINYLKFFIPRFFFFHLIEVQYSRFQFKLNFNVLILFA